MQLEHKVGVLFGWNSAGGKLEINNLLSYFQQWHREQGLARTVSGSAKQNCQITFFHLWINEILHLVTILLPSLAIISLGPGDLIIFVQAHEIRFMYVWRWGWDLEFTSCNPFPGPRLNRYWTLQRPLVIKSLQRRLFWVDKPWSSCHSQEFRRVWQNGVFCDGFLLTVVLLVTWKRNWLLFKCVKWHQTTSIL